MNERRHASRVSRELDDAKSPGQATPAGQRLVHRAMGKRESLPWIMPPANMREKILNAVSESTSTPIPLELPRLRPTPWGLLTAASVAAALGVGVLLGLRLAPVEHAEMAKEKPRVRQAARPVRLAAVVAPETANEQPVVDPLVFVPSHGSSSPIRMGWTAPLRGEVGRMSADAKRAIDAILWPLPLSDGK